jgi:ubiquinone/menaquinone biosynthesis C-methylase UbiE
MRGLYALTRREQDANAAVVPVPEEPARLVDVAGGHGGFAMAMCRRHPTLRATIVDLPASAAVGRRIVAEEGYSDRIEFREGDVFEVGLGEGADVVSAFNLVQHLAPGRVSELFRLARAALREGGCLVVGETERPPASGAVSQVGALGGLLFYAMSGARAYSQDELAGWLRGAGFGEVRVHRNERSPWRIVLIAR